MSTWTIHLGDCLEVMRGLPSASVDAVVTDPPYGLGFMGKAWDGCVPPVDVWRECLRLLKPGGHLLAFAGTRTQHRMACAIEDAGFEIRDMLAWCYGSGFPKSLDVGKALDRKRDDRERILQVTAWIREMRDARGVSNRDIDAAFGFCGMAGHWTSSASQPAVPTIEQVPALLDVLGVKLEDVPEEIRELLWTLNGRKGQPGEAWARREVLAIREAVDTTKSRIAAPIAAQGKSHGERREIAITAPATEAARRWHGWGTALKPALEPITLARKPLRGTVAANVVEHGTGALNVEACRLAGGMDDTPESWAKKGAGGEDSPHIRQKSQAMRDAYASGELELPSGRWPANLVHDGSREIHDLLGDERRFFYCAKASQEDRNAGLDADRNIHATVKPTALMQWLCRLITPPNGVILDPFMGSGSTGRAAGLERFRFIGIERDPEYHAIAERRIRHAYETREPELFDEVRA